MAKRNASPRNAVVPAPRKTAPSNNAAAAAPAITHHGMIAFDLTKGLYTRASGTDNWSVRPIDWPGVPGPPPVGQVLITFAHPTKAPYTILVSACGPLMGAAKVMSTCPTGGG